MSSDGYHVFFDIFCDVGFDIFCDVGFDIF